MATQPNTGPQLDEAFYSLVASHFPRLEPSVSLTPGGSRGLAVASSSTPSALQWPNGNSSASRARSMTPIVGAEHSTAASSTSAIATATATVPVANATEEVHPGLRGHRSSTSIYHPQPTRSGRIPVPPPEEELQAMLAMDNYFEFPSESESDDDDFVMPASEPNDEDDEQEDETPLNDNMPGVPAADNLGQYDENWPTAIDSAEYEWLMDNLKAMEKTATCQSPTIRASTGVNSPVHTSHAETSFRTVPLSPKSLALYASPIDRRRPYHGKGKSNPSNMPASVQISESPRQATKSSRLRSRNSDSAPTNGTPTGGEPLTGTYVHSQPDQILSHSRQVDTSPRRVALGNAPKSSTKARMRTPRQRKQPSESDTTLQSQLETASGEVAALCKLESKRKRNAEQSRTFRERQRALREANSNRLEELEEENEQLRQEVLSLRLQLQDLESASQTQVQSGGKATTPIADQRQTMVTHSKRRHQATPSFSTSSNIHEPKAYSATHQSPQPPSASISFEDLGKFVAGFVQAKSQSASLQNVCTEATFSTDHETSTSPTALQNRDAEVPHPLVLLTQLLAS